MLHQRDLNTITSNTTIVSHHKERKMEKEKKILRIHTSTSPGVFATPLPANISIKQQIIEQ